MNDLEQPTLSYYVIYFKMFRKIMQRTVTEALKKLNPSSSQIALVLKLFLKVF